jgi:hypothetical protein
MRAAVAGVALVWGMALVALFVGLLWPAYGHEIYTGLHGRNGQLCCGGDDCALTLYRERGDLYEFLTRENEWVAIPQARISFLPVPGDPPHDDGHAAHLCYRAANEADRLGASINVFGAIFLYCAFIPPGAI